MRKLLLTALSASIILLTSCNNPPATENPTTTSTIDSSTTTIATTDSTPSPKPISQDTIDPDPQPLTTGKDSIPTIQVKPEPVIPIRTGGAKKKPIIYLYPERETEVTVSLELQDGKLTHTYPKYNPQTGWKVLAKPDGSLFSAQTNKEYYALYWEGSTDHFDAPKTGFVVKGEETAAFLNEKLEILGLSRREANEFMVYWLPELEKNAYNQIHFAQESYTKQARLEITPKPETLIRVFMVYQPLKSPVDIDLQHLHPISRKGFTVVEWGGMKMGIEG